MSAGLQKRGAKASDASSMKPTKKGPKIVRAIPVFNVSGVKEARAPTKPTMAKVEKMIQYRTFPPHLTIAPAHTWPSAVELATVEESQPP